MAKPVVHFEIGCRDREKTDHFYTSLFGWTTTEYGPFSRAIDTGSDRGIPGFLTALGHEPHQYVMVYVEVDDIGAVLQQVPQLGGTVVIPETEAPGRDTLPGFTTSTAIRSDCGNPIADRRFSRMNTVFLTRRMRKLHLLVGFVFIAIFLGTGFYMGAFIPDIDRMDHGQRMMMRSAHVYIVMASLVNVVMGCYLKLVEQRGNRLIQQVGSLLILVAPAVFLAAFFVEPEPGQLSRPVSVAGAGALAIGVVFQAFVMLQQRTPNDGGPSGNAN